jgi:hypothetical protein
MAGVKAHSWKILGLRRGQGTGGKVEKHLHECGYENFKAIGLENDKASDDKVIELLKSDDWVGVSIGKPILFFFK